jgi:hypothetical protein
MSSQPSGRMSASAPKEFATCAISTSSVETTIRSKSPLERAASIE